MSTCPYTKTQDLSCSLSYPYILRIHVAAGSGRIEVDRPPFALPTRAPFAVLEPDADGHRLMYVARVAREAGQNGVPLRLLLSRRDRDKPELTQFISPLFSADMSPAPTLVLVEDTSTQPDIVPFLAAVLDNERVIVPDADRYLRTLARRGLPHGSVLLLMRAKPPGSRGTGIAMMKFLLVAWLRLRYGTLIYRLSATAEGRDAHMLLRWLPFVVDPDPVIPGQLDEQTVLSGMPDLPERFVLVAGRLDARKSIPELLEWAEATRHRSTSLVLAGRLDPRLATRVRHSSSVVVIDRFMSEDELVTLYRRCTAVACLYENEGPAGAVAFARSVGRPVIVWGSRQAAAQAEEAGLLLPARERSVEAIDDALDPLLGCSSWSGPSSDDPGKHGTQIVKIRAGSRESIGDRTMDRFAGRLLGLVDAP